MDVLESILMRAKLVYGAMMFGAATFAGVTFFLVQSGQSVKPLPSKAADILVYVVPGAGVAALIAMALTRLLAARSAAKDVAKQEGELAISNAIGQSFLKVVIFIAVLIEVPTLLATVAAFITGQLEFLAGNMAGLALFGILFPTNGSLERWAKRVTRAEY